MSTDSPNTVSTQIILPGAILKQAREAKGLTVEEMAAISNLTKQVIRGIETDSYDELAGLSFVRGYLKLYSKKLGVDESLVLDPFDAWKRELVGETPTDPHYKGFENHPADSSAGFGTKQLQLIGAGFLVVLVATGTYLSMQEETAPVIVETDTAPAFPTSQSLESSPPLPGAEMLTGDIAESAQVIGTESTDETREGEVATSSEGTSDTVIDTVPLAPSVEAPEPAAATPVVAETPPAEVTPPKPVVPSPPKPVAQKPPVEVAPKPPVETVKLPETPVVAEPVVEVEQPTPARLPRPSRVLAEAENLQPAAPEPSEARVDNRDQDAGLRVLSETVTGAIREREQLGAPGQLQMRFTGESWVEVRDAQGRLILADLMRADREVSLDTWGPIEVLVGAVDSSTVIFNGETQNLASRAYQNVARVTLGAPRN